MERLIAIVGPTAVGKTKVSIDLAKRLGTEIISGDSMLVYRRLNIGSAKPSKEEQQGIMHYLIDILDPDQEYSVADFQHQASGLITSINQQGRIPVLAGGTGLYVRALLEGYQFNQSAGNELLRKELTDLADAHGSSYLHNLLNESCPEKAMKLHPNDRRRVIRALEVFYAEGKPSSEVTSNQPGQLSYDALVIGLTMKRERLYERINQRVEAMLEAGLIEEVRQLRMEGLNMQYQSMQGIGYKEIMRYLDGEVDKQEAVTAIKQATRNFAKRQLTWYRKMPYIQWIDTEYFSDYPKMMAYIYSLVAGKFNLK